MPSTQIKITVLAEDSALDDGLRSEHGLSLWIEAGGLRILFDTGQSEVFLANAKRLGVNAADADAAVLSHGHHDHSGGLAFLGKSPPKRLYLHPFATRPRYRRTSRPPHKAIGMPASSISVINRLGAGLVLSRGPTQISENIGVTGTIPRSTNFEDAGGPFFLDPECSTSDPVYDDQALWIATGSGIVAVFGCAHAGVVNSLDYMSRLLRLNRFRAVIGGLHLQGAGTERITRTAEALDQYHLELLATGHCTGSDLANQYRGTKKQLVAGMVLCL